MKGVCRLCNKSTVLRESHIVPKFVFKWIKQTSVTGYMRQGYQINRRVQDGLKEYMLCNDCEQMLGVCEKWFKETIFIPLNEESISQFAYDERLFYFVNSVFWRIAVKMIRDDKQIIACKHFEKICIAEQNLRTYLLTKSNVEPVNIFMSITSGKIIHASKQYSGLHFYFNRSVDPFIYFDDEACFFYLAIPGMIFFGNIFGIEEDKMVNMGI